MDRNEELKQWLRLPDDNLRTAKYIAKNMHPVPNEIVCNLCQQAAEKYLKYFLFLKNVAVFKTHDLPVLLGKCINISGDFTQLVKKCGFLTQYAVLPKYPNDLQITDSDVATAIKFANAIKLFVLDKSK